MTSKYVGAAVEVRTANHLSWSSFVSQTFSTDSPFMKVVVM